MENRKTELQNITITTKNTQTYEQSQASYFL